MDKSKALKIGRFQVVRKLGKGSQGVVLLAKDPYLQREVAIKALKVKSTGAKAPQSHFLQEARTVSKLQHPNIIPIFEAGEHRGIPYLVFEYVDGISLETIIKKKDSLTIPRAIALMRQILQGVGYAHRQGIIHRDLKPANILVSKNDVPRVMDFGLSRMVDPNKATEQSLDGTLKYMSPEHFSDTPIGPGSDVFALGLIFYEMLTLTPAITGENQFNLIYKIVFEPTVAPSLLNPKLDAGIDSIVLRAVQKELDARFPDANSMMEALDDYVDAKKRGLRAQSSKKETHSTIDFLVRRMRYKTDFPAFSASVMEINRMTSSSSQVSAKELAKVILKDYSLTNKLLKLSNSAFYGHAGGKVTSIYKAVVMLGFDQVRLAASSLMLFTHLQGKSVTEELRDAMIKSFMSGIVARDLAKRARLKNTEVAFICSMFHDLGKNLTIYYFPEEYLEIKNLMAENGDDMQTAVRSVLGISLDELGVGVARTWNFPENIIYCMRGLPSGAVEKPTSIFDQLRHFSVFANELCGLASSGQPENQDEALRILVERFQQSIDISETEVLKLLRSEIKGVENYATILDINPEQSPFIQSLLEFIGTDEEPEDENVSEGQPQPPASGDVDDLPTDEGPVDASTPGDRTKQRHTPSNPEHPGHPIGIWQRFLNLLQSWV